MKLLISLGTVLGPFVFALFYWVFEVRSHRAWDMSGFGRGWVVWSKSIALPGPLAEWTAGEIRRNSVVRAQGLTPSSFVFRFVTKRTFYNYRLDQEVPVGLLGSGAIENGVLLLEGRLSRGLLVLGLSLLWVFLGAAGVVIYWAGWEDGLIPGAAAVFVGGLLSLVLFLVIQHERKVLDVHYVSIVELCQKGKEGGSE